MRRVGRTSSGVLIAVLLVGACAAPSDEPASAPPSSEERPDGERDQGSREDDRESSAEETSSSASHDDAADDEQTEVEAEVEATGSEVDDDLSYAAPEPHPPYELSPDEVLPNAKRLASDVVQHVTTYEPSDSAEELVAGLQDDAEVQRRLARSVAPLHHAGHWSRGRIVYPQLGGSTPTEASVMVVVEQTIGRQEQVEAVQTRTVDVRLTVVDGVWELAAIEDVGGEPVQRPDDLPALAARVLDDERIELPDSAVWDIHAGRMDPRLLELMLAMAEQHRYGVIVLESGHPVNVFGTDRFSSHMYGLAVDIYHLDGRLVVEDREDGSTLHDFVTWLYEREDVHNIGGPWALDGYGGRSFTDVVHQDHLHIEAGPRPSAPPPRYAHLVEGDEDDEEGGQDG